MRNILSIVAKDVKQYYSKSPVISWGFMFPIAIIILLSLGTKVYGEDILVPGMFSSALLFSSTSMVQVAVGFEKMNKTLIRLLVAPVSKAELLTAKAVGGVIYGFIGVVVTWITARLVTGHVLVLHPLMFVLSVTLASLVFALIAELISFLYSPLYGIAVLNIARFSMIFLGGMIVPRIILPREIQLLSYVFPSLYVTESIRYSLYNSWDLVDPATSLIVTLVSAMTLCILLWILVDEETVWRT